MDARTLERIAASLVEMGQVDPVLGGTTKVGVRGGTVVMQVEGDEEVELSPDEADSLASALSKAAKEAASNAGEAAEERMMESFYGG
jgi:DNA-binding protein YbaB